MIFCNGSFNDNTLREDSNEYVVLSLRQFQKPGGYYENKRECSLNAKDLFFIEAKLQEFVTEYNTGDGRDCEFLASRYHKRELKAGDKLVFKSYKRQYLPLINDNGDRLVEVACFCRHINVDWKNERVVVLGGGNCYFGMIVNLTTGKKYDIWVNGPE